MNKIKNFWAIVIDKSLYVFLLVLILAMLSFLFDDELDRLGYILSTQTDIALFNYLWLVIIYGARVILLIASVLLIIEIFKKDNIEQ